MKIAGKNYHTIWLSESNDEVVKIIDQRWLPHKFVIEELKLAEDVAIAITEMHLRGAPLIGVAAAFGMYLASIQSQGSEFQDRMQYYENLLN